ncbi:MAG: FMN-binding protein [Treponema sp.]|jgi:electron transport complex protein RnfG|nr:FMN-binding protein [Treponema sp.]
MRKDFVMPVVVLSLLCLFVAGTLAVGHHLTHPIIERAAAERARMAMLVILPEAEAFDPVDLSLFNLPAAVYSMYSTPNDVGYAVIVITMGFAGEIRVLCGIDPQGRIIRTQVLANSETPSFSAPVFAEAHVSNYWGQDRQGIEAVPIVTGSTVTAVAFKNAVRYALDAFAIVSGGTP